MRKSVIPSPPTLFRSRLLFPAAVLWALAALCGSAAIVMLFLPGSTAKLVEDMMEGGITDASAIQTWTVIHVGLIFAGFVCAAGMAAGLFREFTRKGKGLDLLYGLDRCLLWAVRISGGAVALVMIWRLVRFLLSCSWMDAGIYQLYVMIIPESVMIIQAVALCFLTHRFLDNLGDALASMAYTRVCEKLDDRTIPAFCATGFFVLFLICTYLATERLFTLTIIPDGESSAHYGVLLENHPLLVLSAGMFACVAVANLLMGIYLWRYKRTTGRLIFCPLRETLDA